MDVPQHAKLNPDAGMESSIQKKPVMTEIKKAMMDVAQNVF